MSGREARAGESVSLSRTDAARLAWRYQLSPSSLDGAVERLASVQYDPLSPMGRNVDLVFQARVPGYRVDDWMVTAYRERRLFDAWDKQASLVTMSDWPAQGPFHEWFAERWRGQGLDVDGEEARSLCAELRELGPATSLDVGDQRSDASRRGSWYGPKPARRLLRALWDSGRIVTHHRVAGRHAYAVPERVIPDEVRRRPALSAARALERLVERRVQAAGLVRPSADASVWFLPCARPERDAAASSLVEQGRLIRLNVEGSSWWALPAALRALERPELLGVRFLAPLDALLWDRAAVRDLHRFDYAWEVYKPVAKRRWGYYVLPVAWGESFVARFDARVQDGRLVMHSWHWESDIDPARLPPTLRDDLQVAASEFLAYLGVTEVKLPRGLGRAARSAWLDSAGERA